LTSIDLNLVEIEPAALRMVPGKVARKYLVMPVALKDKTLVLATIDPDNIAAMDEIRFVTGCSLDPVVADESALKDAISLHYGEIPGQFPRSRSPKEVLGGSTLTVDDMASVGLSEVDLDALSDAVEPTETPKGEDETIDLGNLSQSAQVPPVVKLANVLLIDSFKRSATDIHIEPYETEFRARFRIDGFLYNVMALPLSLRDPLIARVKTMARLNVVEKRLPQRGRMRLRLKTGEKSIELDFHVASLPTLWGEKVVLHRLDPSHVVLDMTGLGFEPATLERFLRALDRGRGAVVISGPPRSGRTTTLFSAIARLNRPETNVVTAEEKVEYSLAGVNQVQVRSDIGLTLPAILREFAAHDASVVGVSQIREPEAAGLALKLALLGRLVLADMPGDDGPSTLTYLRGMGVAPFLVSRAVSAVVAQRLVRQLCGCKKERKDLAPVALEQVGFPPDAVGTFRLYKPVGCGLCHGNGYRGRVGLFEVLEVTDAIRDLVAGGAPSVDIKRQALTDAMLTLRMCGLEKIRAGVTTIEEVVRETDL
jgi:type IV pilus assembly protein PilB